MSYIGSKRSSSLVSATEITLDGAKLKSSGDSITKSDGTTAVLSESSGTVTFTTNNAVIEGSSSGDLVRITQTGSGNALVVEDSTNPDSTPFVVTSDGSVGIGTNSPSATLHVANKSSAIGSLTDILILDCVEDGQNLAGGEGSGILFKIPNNTFTSYTGARISAQRQASADTINQTDIVFENNQNSDLTETLTEAMRIDSSGNLLVGPTSSSGSFKLEVSGDTYINGDSRVKSVYPIVTNVYDVGTSSFRFDDIYSVNTPNFSSDRNEKQDIEELTESEQRVAVACKGLLRKFRWKNAVAKKGDDARIHFGIIAQDLQAAFEAEGLDAGRYGMFMSNTWWETSETYTDDEGIEQTRTNTYDTAEEAPDGAVERTRLGVRYSELLAFIIAAI